MPGRPGLLKITARLGPLKSPSSPTAGRACLERWLGVWPGGWLGARSWWARAESSPVSGRKPTSPIDRRLVGIMPVDSSPIATTSSHRPLLTPMPRGRPSLGSDTRYWALVVILGFAEDCHFFVYKPVVISLFESTDNSGSLFFLYCSQHGTLVPTDENLTCPASRI